MRLAPARSTRRARSGTRGALVGLLVATLLAACGPATGGGAGGPGSDGGRLDVVASFYPLAYVAGQVGGRRVDVTMLTPPGAEPHDLELTARQVGQLTQADLVVYLAGFQPAVDTALTSDGGQPGATGPGRRVLEVGPVAGVHGADPHFWTDPTRLAAVAGAVARRLAVLDPAGEAAYLANTRALTSALTALDRDYRAGLSSCRSRDLVVSHDAFGYLASRYHLSQMPIAGLDPQAEPSPTRLAALVRYVRAHHVTTVYTETLVSPEVAQTLAREAGVRVGVLDPVEGLTDRSPGSDYLQIMRANLAALRQGLGCR
jgi:zinc transport system substrate-binding protein